MKNKTEGEFSVFWYDTHGILHEDKRFVSGQEAIDAAFHLSQKPSPKEIVITDGDDRLVVRCVEGVIVYPPKEELV